MEKILALYDTDPHYSERLGRFLENQSDLPFHVYRFQDPEMLREFSGRKEIDVLLSDEHCTREALSLISAREVLYLSENSPPEGRENAAIYKYQSGEGILRELMKHYDAGPAPASAGLARLYMVFSPLGRIGKSCFALTLARLLAEDRPVLYLSLEESTAFAQERNIRHSGTLSEALYYYKQGALDGNRLKSFIYDAEGLSYIPPVRNPEDISALSPKELSGFLEQLLRLSSFSAVILDTDTFISRAAELFPLAERVLIPIREDRAARHKLSLFQDFLTNARLLREPERYIRLLLPEDNAVSDSAALLTRGLSGPLQDYARAVLQNYIL